MKPGDYKAVAAVMVREAGRLLRPCQETYYRVETVHSDAVSPDDLSSVNHLLKIFLLIEEQLARKVQAKKGYPLRTWATVEKGHVVVCHCECAVPNK